MAFLRFAYATRSRSILPKAWGRVRVASTEAPLSNNLVAQASEILEKKFNPDDYLLTHATIVASVDTYDVPGVKLGSVTEGSFKIKRKYADYRIEPKCDPFINSNFDSWERKVLLKSYPTFIGGHNFCFAPDTKVQLADGSFKAIQDVVVGDTVFTHTGNARKVTQVFSRDFTGSLRALYVNKAKQPILATDNHPFRAIQVTAKVPGTYRNSSALSRVRYYKNQLVTALRGEKHKLLDFQAVPQWAPAGSLEVGQYLLSPTFQMGSHSEPNRALLLGYYLAEGCQLTPVKDTGVCFSFGPYEKAIADTVLDLMRKEFSITSSGVYRTQTTWRVNVCSVEAAVWFRKYGGHLAAQKRLSVEVFTWDLESRLQLLAGWLTGDGDLHAGTLRLRGATVSENLCHQLRSLADTCGIKSCVVFSDMHIGEVQGQVTLMIGGEAKQFDIISRSNLWTLLISTDSTTPLIARSPRWSLHDAGKKREDFCWWQGHRAFRVQANESFPYTGKVYNLEVEEDHSYVVDPGIAVHNCEHVQLEEQSKGRILDAVARDIGDSVYIDILIATALKHRELVKDIQSGEMSTLSMGCSIDESQCTQCGHVAVDETEMCFPPDTRVLLSDGTYRVIQDVVVGDLVVTHTGSTQPVTEVMSRDYTGDVVSLNVDGVPALLQSTPNHPYWVLQPRQLCACGCGEKLKRTVEHRRGSVKAFQRRFCVGHSTRLRNPNKYASNVLSLADYTRIHDTEFDFVSAQQVQAGDYLGFPIPQGTVNTEDATESKARLIGYFLAEGCYLKREGCKVGVSFTFGHHEEDTLVREVQQLLDAEFGEERRTKENWKLLPVVAPIRRRITSREVPTDMTCPSCQAPVEYIYNVRFKPGCDDCYQCKVCGRNWIQSAEHTLKARVYKKPLEIEASGSIAVNMFSEKAVDFFYRYCGEYSNEKCLHSDVMKWDPTIQRNVLNCWLNGDGNQSVMGVTGNTASFQLVSQMHVLAARCGVYARRNILFGGCSAVTKQVVNGDGSVSIRDERGWLPSFSLTLPAPTGFADEPRFSNASRTIMNALTDSYKRIGNWLLYRVRSTATESYSGIVHNLEVAQDHSYVVEGVAVHNCEHVKYSKGNQFYDEQGRRHRVAELCGHHSIKKEGGVHFIEASWAGVPAFTGAVLRSIITPEEVTIEKIKRAQAILNNPPKVWTSKKLRGIAKAAALLASTKCAFDFGGGGDEEGGGEEEAPAKGKSEVDMLSALEETAQKEVLQRVRKKLHDALNPPNPPDLSKDSITDKTLVTASQWAADAYRNTIATVTKLASSDVALINSIAEVNGTFGVVVPLEVYRAALRVGSTLQYPDLRQYLLACRREMGKEPSSSEARTLIRLGNLLAQKG
jgi:hypothetical protein